MKYKEINDELEKLNNTIKEKAISLIFSIILSILIISAPLAVLINLMIYKNYLKLIVFGIAILLIFAFFMIFNIYYVALSKGKIKKVYIVALADTIIPAIFIFGIMAIIFYIGVV